MLKKDITFENLDGQMVTKTFYFNLNKAELVQLEVEGGEGGFQEAMQKIVDSRDGKAIMDQFRRIILLTVGYRHEDGIRFVKNDEYRDAFEQSGAYSELFISLVTDAQAGADFINGVIPRNLAEKVRNMQNAPGVPQDFKKKADTVQTAETNTGNVFDIHPSQEAEQPEPAQDEVVHNWGAPAEPIVPANEGEEAEWVKLQRQADEARARAEIESRHSDKPVDPAEQYLHDPNKGLSR